MSRLAVVLVPFATALALACGSATTQGAAEKGAAPTETAAPTVEGPALLDGLGDQRRPITTASGEAQRYFDQGLALIYGFNHDAAIRAFDHALAVDPSCAMCAWGKATALGPNINLPLGPAAAEDAYAAGQRALELSKTASPVEQELIAAVAARYTPTYSADRAALDLQYANAMREVRKNHPGDVDVAVLTAEALMNLYPWSYWTPDAKPKEHTAELVALLEWAMAQEPTHIGANHYYIHAMEEHFPEKAEPAADRLAPLAPDAGHLVHMPGHIYYRVGRYADAAAVNVNAIASDEAYFARCRPGDFYRAAYYPHNIHFLWAAAATEGQSTEAMATARSLAAKVEEFHAELPLVEEFLAIPVLTLVRFGRWDAVLGEPAPPAGRPYQGAMWHYARGVAFARTGKKGPAAAELAIVRAAAKDKANEELLLAGNTATAAALIAIGEAHLEGELFAVTGDTKLSIAALERAVALQDALIYMEPPPFYFPTRQALGAVLLDAGRAKEAEAVYRADLDMWPKNGWSLFGLSRALLAQRKSDQAAWADEGFQRAWQRADVKLSASRF
jgi:tetratricopeptide (TPR) repeat protein